MNLHPDHLADLRKSGLNDDTIKLMSVRSLSPREIDKLAAGGLQKVESVLEFPYPTAHGFSRYKLFPPQDGMKYFQKKGSGNHLYILPPVAELITDLSIPLAFSEGEKKSGAAIQQGIIAIGISGIWNWKAKDDWRGIEELQLIPFADRGVEIIPDSDTWQRDDLQQAVYAFARYLEFRGAKVSVVILPQVTKDKTGLDDFFLSHSREDFDKLKRLPIKHQTLAQHKAWYESWKAEKSASTDDGLQGKPIFLREIEPYKEAVSGAELLIDLCREIRRYVVAEPTEIVAIALWCVHAHAIDAFPVSPFLNPKSPEPGCGKTTTCTVISNLIPRPLLSGNLSPASIFRAIEKYKPSFLIDEADSFENLNEELRGLLNASHLRASAQAIRVAGDDHEPRIFSTWCPKIISLIGNLPATLADRSIVIEMKRRTKNEHCERFSAIDPHPELELLAQKIARWTKDSFDALRSAKPDADGIDLRVYDNWMPLLTIADRAGGQWPKWIRITANWFLAKAADSTLSIKVELLADVAQVMSSEDRMFSEDIVKALADMADRPWPTFAKGKPINQLQLGRVLRSFGLKSQTIRVKAATAKGYYTHDVVTLRDRYYSPQEAQQASQKIKDSEIKELEAIFVTLQSVTKPKHEVSQNTETDPWEAEFSGEGIA